MTSPKTKFGLSSIISAQKLIEYFMIPVELQIFMFGIGETVSPLLKKTGPFAVFVEN